MTLYTCFECKETFNEPVMVEVREPCEYWGFRSIERIKVLICPHCDSDEIDEHEDEDEAEED